MVAKQADKNRCQVGGQGGLTAVQPGVKIHRHTLAENVCALPRQTAGVEYQHSLVHMHIAVDQVKYKKVGGEEPGKELREKSYSFKEAANILGIHDSDLYDIWKNEKLEYITVDFVRRIPVDIFEKWYADQDIYRKVTHIPTAEELEKDYICLQDAADMLGISREKLAKIARCEEIGRLLNSTICNNKRWITRKSFQLFLNAQNVYHITDDGDRQEESQVLQEKETLSLMVKEYISRQDAAELAGVNVSTVTKWMQSGEFQCIGAGKVLRIHRQQFLNWLNEHREGVV